MDLVIVRHGRAGSPAEFAKSGMSDDLRPLTVEGRKRMRDNADGLKATIESLEAIANSPLVRAVETAQIVAKAFGKVKIEELPDLAPGGKRERVLKWIAQHPLSATIAVVGHEPSLSALTTWLVGGLDEPVFELKKGGACCVRFEDRIAAGTGKLEWLMTPRQLRRMAR
jgi:phosphohistidine phosphatase